MKVLFLSSSSGSRGGGELYLLFLGGALAKQGIEVALWCSRHPRMNELATSFLKFGKVFRSAYANTYDYKVRSLRYLVPEFVKGVEKAADDFKPQVIHLNKQNIEDGLDLLKTLDRLNRPYVTTIHITQTQQSLGALMGRFRDAVARKALLRANSMKWITVSPNRYDDLNKFLRVDKKTMMITNGVTIEELSPSNSNYNSAIRESLNIPENNLVVISVGRLEPQKNPLKFIDWAAQCLLKERNMNFLWIGDGRLKNEFEQKVRSLNLDKQIRCIGWQNDVKPFYAIANLYLHTANFEGMPFSLLEAMSHNLTCVVSEELYKDLSFPEGILGRGIDGLIQLLSDRNLMLTQGILGYEYVRKNFSVSRMTNSYLDVYKEVIQ